MTIYNVPPSLDSLRLWDRDILNVTAGGTVYSLWIGDGAVANVDTPDRTGVFDALVKSGGTLNVNKGYAKYSTIESGGTATFFEGSTSVLTTLNGGQLTAPGGLTLYTTINGGEQSIQGKGIAFYTKINGGTEVVHGTSNDPEINGGGKQQVAYSGTVNKATLKGGLQEVFGRAFETTIESGTQRIGGAVGLADHTTMNGGLQVVQGGGTANYTTIKAGAQRVETGSTANHATVEDGALQNIEAGGVANYTTIEGGGSLSVAGTANFTTIEGGGEADVLAGGTADHGTLLGGATLTVHAGGTANNTLLDGGGLLRVEAGGTSNDTSVTSGGEELVLGTANGTTVNGAAEQTVKAGGTANDTTIEAGGRQTVAGTANDTTIKSSGKQTVAATGTTNDITFDGDRASLSLVTPANLTGTIANWVVGDVIDFTGATVTEILETADDRLIVSWGSGKQAAQVTYTLVDEQADTHVAFAGNGQGGTKLFLEADSGSPLLAAFIEIDSAAAGTLGSSTIGLDDGAARVVLDAMAVRQDLVSAGGAVPADWFATVRGTDHDDWIRGSSGDDTIDGGGGDDVVAYSQAAEHYTITANGEVITVHDRSGHDGTDTLTNIDRLEFEGSVLDAALLTRAATLSRQQLGDLAELYAGYFGRAPDAPGLAYWASRMADGMSLDHISRSFFAQPETAAHYPAGMTTGSFIAQVYQNVLGRAPDQAGLAYWSAQLDNGALARDVFVLAIINGAKAPTGNAADARLLANKQAVGLHFAVDHGLGDLAWATEVMQHVDGTSASVSQADRMTDGFAAHAVTADPRLLLPLVSAANSASKSVTSGDWLAPTTWSANAVPDSEVHVTVSSATVVTLAASGRSGDLSVDAAARLDLLENSYLWATRINNRGEFEVHKGGFFTTAGWSENHGTISATEGGRIDFYGRLNNHGTVIAEGAGSSITFYGGFTNSNHTVQVVDGGQIDFASGQASTSRNDGAADLLGDSSILKIRHGGGLGVVFHAGNQTLVLGKSNEFKGRVTGFEAGDTIHVLDVDASSSFFELEYDGGRSILTVTDGFVEANIAMVGVRGNFTYRSDGAEGTLIELAA